LLAPRFGAEKNFANAVKLSAYSHTPLWLAGIFLLVPGLSFLLILGLYGFYLLWIGLPMLMKVADDKALPYAAAVTACALILAVVLTFVRNEPSVHILLRAVVIAIRYKSAMFGRPRRAPRAG